MEEGWLWRRQALLPPLWYTLSVTFRHASSFAFSGQGSFPFHTQLPMHAKARVSPSHICIGYVSPVIYTAMRPLVRTYYYAMGIPRLATSCFQLIFPKWINRSTCFEMSALLIWPHLYNETRQSARVLSAERMIELGLTCTIAISIGIMMLCYLHVAYCNIQDLEPRNAQQNRCITN
jgi:hypothetical protein